MLCLSCPMRLMLPMSDNAADCCMDVMPSRPIALSLLFLPHTRSHALLLEGSLFGVCSTDLVFRCIAMVLLRTRKTGVCFDD